MTRYGYFLSSEEYDPASLTGGRPTWAVGTGEALNRPSSPLRQFAVGQGGHAGLAGRGDLLVSRDAHKSVVAGLVFGGVQPDSVRHPRGHHGDCRDLPPAGQTADPR
jgi:hypothetical protein